MTALSLLSVVERRTEPLSTTVDDDLVMLDPRTGTYLGFDGVGRRIWELLDGGRTIDDLCRTLLEEFDAEPETCRTDVVAFVGELLDADLAVIR